MMRNTQYNCKLGKGCGLIEETLSLLEIYLISFIKVNQPLAKF